MWEGPGGQFTVAGLDPDTQYWFGLKAVDDVGLESPVATDHVTTDHTHDIISPDPVTELTVAASRPARSR